MRQEPISTNNECVDNRVINNFKTSSSFCVFTHPVIDVINGGKISSGLTINSPIVNIVDKNQLEFQLNMYFIENSGIINDGVTFNYEIYKFNKVSNFFSTDILVQKNNITKNSLVGSINYDVNLMMSNLQPDSEYVIKITYNFNNCNYILNLFSDKTTTVNGGDLMYGVYNDDYDFYFIIVTNPDKPILSINTKDELIIGSLLTESFIVKNEKQTIVISEKYAGSPIVSLNGLVLTLDGDYTITNNIINFTGRLNNGDIINVIYTLSGYGGGINNEVFGIGNVVSGVTNGELDNRCYYNTDTQKYEVFIENVVNDFSSIILSLNGAILLNGVDFYQSISNPKKIILNGILLNNDILNVFYSNFDNFDGGIESSDLTLFWSIDNPIENEDGSFIVNVSKDKLFNTIHSTVEIPYENYISNYVCNLSLPGSFGDKYFVKIVNKKTYTNVLNETIILENESETLKLVLKTNNNNSY